MGAGQVACLLMYLLEGGTTGGAPRGDVEEVPHPPNRSGSFGRHELWGKRELVSSPESAFYRLHDLV